MVDRKKAGEAPKSKAGITATALVEAIEKKHGAGSAMLMGAGGGAPIQGILKVSSHSLNKATGRKGAFPYGRLTVVAGSEGSGKTSLLLDAAKCCQRDGGQVVFIDAEFKLDIEYAARLGVSVDDLIISQPPHLEQALETIETIIDVVEKQKKAEKREIPLLVILDSMTAIGAKAEMEGEYDDQHYSPQARVMSSGLKKLIPRVGSHMVALVFVSQMRQKIGVMFGPKEDTTCGKAPKFYAALQMSIERKATLWRGPEDKKEHYGQECEVFMSKNQIGAPYKRAKMFLIWGEGFEPDLELFEFAKAAKLAKTSGSWTTLETPKYPEIKYQGRDGFLKKLNSTKGLRAHLLELMEAS